MNRITVCVIALIIVASIFTGIGPLYAETWDAAANFWTDNVNYVWTYGYKPLDITGVLTPYNLVQWGGATNILEWVNSSTFIGDDSRSFYSTSYLNQWGVWWKAYGMNMHPGPNGQHATVRWTSPYTGLVDLSVKAMGRDTYGTTSDVIIWKNNATTLWSCNVNGFAGHPDTGQGAFGSSPSVGPWTSNLYMIYQGETIECLVGWGSNANYYNDNTGIEFKIVPSGSISGTITSSLSGTPSLYGATVTTSPGSYAATTDFDGDYKIYAPVGTYTVSVSEAHHTAQNVSNVVVSQDATNAVSRTLSTSKTSWVAQTDFWTDNPRGAWSWGYRPLDVFGNFASFNLVQYISGTNTLEWINNGTFLGYISRNFNSTSYQDSSGTWWKGYGSNLRPGQYGDKAVVRWMAPFTGSVSVSAIFKGRCANTPNGTTSDGHVMVNNVPIWDCTISGFAGHPDTGAGSFGTSPSATYSGTLSVTRGDTIDCVVGWGSNGNYVDDATGLEFTITRL